MGCCIGRDFVPQVNNMKSLYLAEVVANMSRHKPLARLAVMLFMPGECMDATLSESSNGNSKTTLEMQRYWS